MRTQSVLHYVVSPTRVGRVFVLMSRSGVVDVVLDVRGKSPGRHCRSLSSRFPNTRLLPDDGAHGSWAAAVVAHIDGKRDEVGAPLDLMWSPPPGSEAVVSRSAGHRVC